MDTWPTGRHCFLWRLTYVGEGADKFCRSTTSRARGSNAGPSRYATTYADTYVVAGLTSCATALVGWLRVCIFKNSAESDALTIASRSAPLTRGPITPIGLPRGSGRSCGPTRHFLSACGRRAQPCAEFGVCRSLQVRTTLSSQEYSQDMRRRSTFQTLVTW